MSVVENKRWHPDISPKQQAVLDELVAYILLSGPRKASKTIGGLHRLMQHAWECPLGNISMCGRTLTDNFDGGAWNDLVGYILPQWIGAEFGMELVTPPKMDGLTHKLYMEVSNYYGGKCRIQLDSLNNEKQDEVERIFKGKRFSMIYMTEGSNFKRRETLDIMLESLRMIGLPDEEHLLIVDTNPAVEGEDSWLYQLWFEFPFMDEETLIAMIVEKNPDADQAFIDKNLPGLKDLQRKLVAHEFTIDDNPYLTEEQKRGQFARYAHNQDMLDRYYYGKWKKASGDSLFKEQFRPVIHVIGDNPNSRKLEPEMLVPEDNCSRLGTGWDLGDANNAFHLVEPCTTQWINPKTKQLEEISAFKVLDEFVEIGFNMPLEEVVNIVEEKMDFWEGMLNQKAWWVHISDRSAFEKYHKIEDTFEWKEIYNLSDERIELQRGPVKKRGSVQQRVNLLRKLLFYDRLFVNAYKCPRTVEMLNNLKKGKVLAVDPQSPYKHPFDSLTYLLAYWCADELEQQLRNRTNMNATARIIHVALR